MNDDTKLTTINGTEIEQLLTQLYNLVVKKYPTAVFDEEDYFGDRGNTGIDIRIWLPEVEMLNTRTPCFRPGEIGTNFVRVDEPDERYVNENGDIFINVYPNEDEDDPHFIHNLYEPVHVVKVDNHDRIVKFMTPDELSDEDTRQMNVSINPDKKDSEKDLSEFLMLEFNFSNLVEAVNRSTEE